MEESDKNGRNTFLSRVFGMQSDEVSSMHTQGLSTIPLGDEEEGDSIPDTDDDNRDGVRILESDQGSSSQDSSSEDFDEEESNDISRPLISDPESIELDRFSSDRNKGLIESSIPKIGQPSSDEEDVDLNSSAEIDLEQNNNIKLLYHDDDKTPKDKAGLNHLGNSTLLKRIMRGESSSSSRYPSKDAGSSHKQGNDKEFSSENYSSTFLNTVKGEAPRKRYKLRKPNILNALSVVNNMSERRYQTLNPKERALWKWANVENLDIFLQDAYNYYMGNGYYCIIIQKVLNIATLIFVVFISSFMGYCIDYSQLPESRKFSDIKIEHCYANNITGFTKLLLYLFYVFVGLKIVQLGFDIKNIREMYDFYHHLLNISDDELQTIPWQNIIQQLMYLKDQNALTANVVAVKAKNKLNAHGVANRIMRKENYLIALYNNDVLDLSLPIPFLKSSPLTKTLEWNINLCVMGFVFNDAGFIKQGFLKESQRTFFINELQKRFMLAGFLNIVLSPFLVSYFVLLYFFRYFNEYKTSPESIGARQYTPLAEWKFREYNELYHIFRRRIGLSTEIANRYIDQFPKEKMNLVYKFISFISGSFVAILALLTLWDPENFLNFEITKDKTVLFYITILGAIWSVSQGSVSKEYHVFDPEETLRELASFTHYLPESWKDRFHTEAVKLEFCDLYNLRITILLRELASLITTPFILWFSLPDSAGKIVDFFRETSVYIDGLGYVCKFAVYDGDPDAVKKHFQNEDATNNEENQVPDKESDSEPDEAVKKMMQSYMYFLDDYENESNMLGKYQIPAKRRESFDQAEHRSYEHQNTVTDGGSEILANKYSWKKQFRPGQKPELFRIGHHVLDDNRNYNTDNKKQTLDESFLQAPSINGFDGNDDRSNKNLVNQTDHLKGGGVLGLVKEYYKQSDVGR
ncbi:Autophagy-related protein 9 [Nakaseomyces bracarensis]|uniref:Autophagy-related protein 9 n=1 Tax=Nakaseomyces bracarensis TaxID=273131 RepID=A0ABR4NVX9_9SACH